MDTIINETDLHTSVVKFIRENYPSAILVAGLGEYQNTKDLRVDCWKKGYQKGQPDLMILNKNFHFSAFAIEFKSPKGTGELSLEQKRYLARLRKQNWKTMVSNDYVEIIIELTKYFEWCGEYLWFQKNEFNHMLVYDEGEE